MKKREALKRGYCKHCAAASTGRQLCGVTRGPADRLLCSLDTETRERWKKEHDLDREPIRRPLKK